MADEFVAVPGGPNNNNYANVRLIVELAEACSADAVWAGWGHASENPRLPESLRATERGIIFIGPPAAPMKALGDKIGSTLIAQSAHVPTIAWNGDGITVTDDQARHGIPEDIYARGCVASAAAALDAAERIGFPVMIKASEGGGGKGIRLVREAESVAAAFRQVQTELPGSPVFVMKLAGRARHLEVQLLADMHGQALALSGRDCSVQRRHQKIVEEGPPLAAPREVWRAMERAAVRLAKAVDYVNAGTVEYLFCDTGEFYFLELNPRLQVEHPVTEMITGVNLPAAQLLIAMGIPLHRIPDIRRLFRRGAYDASPIDFDNETLAPDGHVIAARITAENPDAGFQPTSGAIEEVNFRSTRHVWGYFSVDSSGRVHEYADSQIGHLFAWGDTRQQARKHMVLALKELSIRGDIRTTVEYLVPLMESADFQENRIDTGWLDERIRNHKSASAGAGASKPEPLLAVMIGALCRAHAVAADRQASFIAHLERGQQPPSSLLEVGLPVELIYENVKYVMRTTLAGPNVIGLSLNRSYVQAEIRVLSDGGRLVLLGGRSHVAYTREDAAGLRLLLNGQTCVFSSEYDPTCLRASMAGKLVRFLVPDGSRVAAGAPYAEIEVSPLLGLTVGRLNPLLRYDTRP
jgi:acetyl-CoA carboxylase/biotin carboxylase 1